nr:unnamed protein product [Naegleria fowleri]
MGRLFEAVCEEKKDTCLRNIEHVGVFSDTAKNSCRSIAVPFQFPFTSFPKLKYMTLRFLGTKVVHFSQPNPIVLNHIEFIGKHAGPRPFSHGQYDFITKRSDEFVEHVLSVVRQFPKQYLRVEPYILALLKVFKFDQARYLIENFNIDEDYFSYVWNIANVETYQHYSLDQYRTSISLLAQIKQKCKGVVIKRSPGHMPNLTISFLTFISDNQLTDLLKSLTNKYGIYIGNFGCSLLYVLSGFMID